MSTDTAANVLRLEDVEVFYEGIIRALDSVSLRVGAGEIVALLGANGAGKTTTLKAVSGLLRAERGAITRGQVWLRGRPEPSTDPRRLVRAGLVQVIEGRRCFAQLTVLENLLSGTLGTRGLLPSRHSAEVAADLERVLQRFPRLRERARSRAGLLSGGEQQMLAIGRALMARPQILLLDEPSMGLAPLMVNEIFEIIAELNRNDGLSVLVAEQNARVALRYAHRGYVIETGSVVAEGSAAELRARDDVKEFYLGLNHAQRRAGPVQGAVVSSNGSASSVAS